MSKAKLLGAALLLLLVVVPAAADEFSFTFVSTSFTATGD
jgi:hypothetical protein